MKFNLFLALFLLANANPLHSRSTVAQKCETYEEDCERGGNDSDEPTRPADPEDPDGGGNGL